MANQDYEILLKIRADIAQAIAGIGQLNDQAKQTRAIAAGVGGALKDAAVSLAGFIGLSVSLEGIKNEFAEIFANADNMHKLSQQTGLSTDAIQGLTEAARENNAADGAMATGLQKLTDNIGKARTGSSQALQPFRDLQINFKDFQKLSPDEQFQLIAQRLAEVKNPADEARIGVQLFGKQFLDIKPTIEAVANEGLQPFLDKAKELGVYLSGDMITQLKAVHDQLGDIQTETQGVATEFLSGFAPALDEGLGSLIKSTSGVTNGFKTLGSWIGTAFKSVLLVIEDVGSAIGIVVASSTEDFQIRWETTVKNVTTYFEGLKKNISLIMSGHFGEASDNGAAVFAQIAKNTADAQKRLAAMPGMMQSIREAWDQNAANLFPGDSKTANPAAPSKPDSGIGISTGDLKQLLQARNTLLQTELDNELKLYEAQAKLKSTQEQADYEQGKLSLKQYFADRAQIINGQYDLQIKALKDRQAQIEATPLADNNQAGELEKQNDLAKVAGDLQQAEIGRQQALLSLTLERQQAERQLFQDKLQAEAKIATLEGNRVQAERDLLQIELQQLDLQLRKAGVPDSDREQALALAQQQGEAKANFDEAVRQGDAALNSLQTGIADINNQVASGQLFAINGEERIAQIEKDRLPALQQIADAMLAAAQATGDPQMIAQAEAFNQKLKEVAVSADLVGQHIAQFKADAQDAFENGLYNFFTTGIEQAHSLGDAFRSLGLDIAKSLEQAAAKQLALLATQKLFSLFDHQTGDQNQDVSSGAVKLTLASGTLALGATLLGSNADKLQQAATMLLAADAVGVAAGFAEGGYTGPGGVNEVAGVVHRGEGVLSQPEIAALGGPAGFHALRHAIRFGYAEGGLVTSPFTTAPSPQQLGFATSQRPQFDMEGNGNGGGRGNTPAVALRIVNQVDQQTTLDHVASAEGEQVVMNIISRNQTKVRQLVK